MWCRRVTGDKALVRCKMPVTDENTNPTIAGMAASLPRVRSGAVSRWGDRRIPRHGGVLSPLLGLDEIRNSSHGSRHGLLSYAPTELCSQAPLSFAGPIVSRSQSFVCGPSVSRSDAELCWRGSESRYRSALPNTPWQVRRRGLDWRYAGDGSGQPPAGLVRLRLTALAVPAPVVSKT